MKEYSQLTLSQRYAIGALKKAGHRQQRIAEIVEPHPSTISRELRRNKSSNGYYPRAAHEQAQQRHLHKRRAYKWTGHWGRIIERKLRLQWSPEQISGWLFCQHYFRFRMSVFISIFAQTGPPLARCIPIYVFDLTLTDRSS